MDENNNDSDKIRIKILQEKAAGLPYKPGIYIMKDKSDKIIYVGKSKALRNRVSQYFADFSRHDLKTQKMVGYVTDFDYILTDTDIEALTLENQLIKLHMPKFNIKLKDGKSYPYIKITLNEAFPKILVSRKRLSDGAKYFGPYSSAGTAYSLVRTAQKAFKLASCGRDFPREIGKIRPCIFYQMNQCLGPCTGKVSGETYKESYKDVITFLRGSYTKIKVDLEEQMEFAAENLMFEKAAVFRDRIGVLDRVWSNQKVVGDPNTEQDVIALYEDDLCSCITIFYIRDGSVVDSEHNVYSTEQIIDDENITAFLTELYKHREYIPRDILLNIKMSDDSESALAHYLSDRAGYRVHVRTPERGDLKALCSLVYDNAAQYAKQYKAESEKDNKTLVKLASMLSLEVIPERIESFDISNMGSENVTAGMVVTMNTKFVKSEYRTYKIAHLNTPDDYGAMKEAVSRRLKNHGETVPDLILLDGGKGHVSTIKALLAEMNLAIPVFGMVKDDFHKTRALTSESEEISIAREQPVFQFIYKIQEETHRYAITQMTNSRSRAVKMSSLEKINGIGGVKAKELLRHFKTVANLKSASLEELTEVKNITQKNAEAIIEYYKNKIDNGLKP